MSLRDEERTMADPTRDGELESVDADPDTDGPGVVAFTREADGTLTARDSETGLARAGHTRAEALARLAEALAETTPDDDDDGEAVDPDALLDGEGLVDADETRRESDLPEFLE
jgi:hypothetical protein